LALTAIWIALDQWLLILLNVYWRIPQA
jgi:hypothetical protein